ncbi:hypothetical protein HF695_19325, partial [Bacillus safensis]|uniref:hypothetical protein n=1 Tax=Bacillus safensis TaxID=561879 RepID=UPI001BA44233
IIPVVIPTFSKARLPTVPLLTHARKEISSMFIGTVPCAMQVTSHSIPMAVPTFSKAIFKAVPLLANGAKEVPGVLNGTVPIIPERFTHV